MDRDLAALQEVRDRLAAARDARVAMESATQQDADRWAKAVVDAGRRDAVRLARLAVEETGMGHVTGKTLKNVFATEFTWRKIADLKTVGIIARDEAKGIIEIAHPAGVVAAIIPTTNPTSTALFKIIIAMKSRCPIVVSPHPSAKRCIAEACRIAAEAARDAGAPPGAVGWLADPTLDSTQALMKHRWTSIVLATGGPGLVEAAYSSGKPAIGVGAGNAPVYVHPSADVARAVKSIVLSQVFDNGTICSSEQSVVLDRSIEAAALDQFRRHGAHICSPAETKALEPVVNKGGHMNPKIVGKAPHVIASMAGFRVPETTTVLIVPYEKVGPDAPLSIEKLSPVLTVYVVDGFKQALERCGEVLRHGGLGHTCAIHSQDKKVVEEFALAMPAMRIDVNSPSTQGSIGYTTNLDPSMTLGCGTPGGNIYSDNIGPLHLINTKRVAYVNEAMLAEDERLEHELRRELGDVPLPWGPGAAAAALRSPETRSAEPQAWKPSTSSAQPAAAPKTDKAEAFGASPLTPSDIEAILAKNARR